MWLEFSFNVSWFYLENIKLLEKLVTLVNVTSTLVNGLMKKLVALINGTNALVNGSIEKLVVLVNVQSDKLVNLVIE